MVRETFRMEGGPLTKSQFVAKLAELTTLSKKQADDVLTKMTDMIIGAVKKGDAVKIPNLGAWKKRKTSARMGRNPQTGSPIQIPARRVVRFTAGKALKSEIH